MGLGSLLLHRVRYFTRVPWWGARRFVEECFEDFLQVLWEESAERSACDAGGRLGGAGEPAGFAKGSSGIARNAFGVSDRTALSQNSALKLCIAIGD